MNCVAPCYPPEGSLSSIPSSSQFRPWDQKGWAKVFELVPFRCASYEDWIAKRLLGVVKLNKDGSADVHQGYTTAQFEVQPFVNYEKKLMVFMLVERGSEIILGPKIVRRTFEEAEKIIQNLNLQQSKNPEFSAIEEFGNQH